MRWWSGRDPGSCTACDADLERGAVWCGTCGARVDAVTTEIAGDRDLGGSDSADDPADLPVPRPSGTLARSLAAVTVLALVVVALVVRWDQTPTEALLGRLDGSTGLSASGPLPTGLRMAWSHEPSADDEQFTVGPPPETLVVADGRVRVGAQVVDSATGRLVRRAQGLWRHPGRDRAVVDGDELVVLDTLTGAVRSRVPLPSEVDVRGLWSTHRSGAVSLLSAADHSTLLTDDGTVVARPEGALLDHVDRALDDPAAFPLRRRRQMVGDDLTAPVRLVAAATGRDVAVWDGEATRVADVVGDLAMVAEADGVVDLFSPAAISDVPWTLDLLDARTGERWRQLEVAAMEPPRLLGRFTDGTAVVALRSRDAGGFRVLAVARDGPTRPVAAVEVGPGHGDSGLYVRSSTLHALAVAGDVLVVRDRGGGVAGLDRAGAVLWRTEVAGVTGLRAADGHVALLQDRGRAQVLRAADGEVVANVPRQDDPWVAADRTGTPTAVLGGHLALDREGRFPFRPTGHGLGRVVWLDLRTGERTTNDEVLGPFLAPEQDGVGLDWSFHGTTADAAGTAQPVVTRLRSRGGSQLGLELLEPHEGFTAFELPVPAADGRPGSATHTVGATGERLVVWTDDARGPPRVATHVLQRGTGAVTSLDGLRGLALVGDTLLAEELDDDWTVRALVGIDVTTGQRRWTAAPGEPFPGRQVLRVDGTLVVDPGPTRVTARSMDDGSVLWSHASDVALTGDVVLGPAHVVVTTTAGGVVALDRRDGTTAWRTELGRPATSVAGAGDHVVVGTADGLVVHLDGAGEEVQRIAVGTGAVHAVAALPDTLVVTVDQRVLGLRADGTGIARRDRVPLP